MKARVNFLVFLIGVSTVFFSCKTVPQSQEKHLKPKTGKKVFVEVSERIADAGQLSAGQLADYFMRLAKNGNIIGGVILAGLMKQDIDYLILSIVGGVVVVLFLLFGIWLINYANRNRKRI